MSTFLSGLLSAPDTPPAPPTPPNGEKRTGDGYKKCGGETRSAKVQAKYAVAFASPKTATDAALEMGISHVGCLNQLYRYEKKEFIERLKEQVVVGAGASAILWRWIKK